MANALTPKQLGTFDRSLCQTPHGRSHDIYGWILSIDQPLYLPLCERSVIYCTVPCITDDFEVMIVVLVEQLIGQTHIRKCLSSLTLTSRYFG